MSTANNDTRHLPFFQKLHDRVDRSFRRAKDPSFWALDSLGIDLYDNQIEVINAVCDLSIDYVAILMARGSGKTFAVSLGLIKLCLENPGFRIGIFAPKADQANRVVKEMTNKILTPTSKCYGDINWNRSSGSRMVFNNGSEIISLSGSESSQQEGYHFHLVVLDECHRISDVVVNQRILPMLGSFSTAKMIKIGISMYRQNFWKSCCSPNTKYHVIKRDWLQCPILFNKGSVFFDGVEYPKFVLDQVPLSMKKKMFPKRPDLHYEANSTTELDFNTQYAMVWAHDINLVLSEDDQTRLVSGNFDIIDKGRHELTDRYFFGLDTASGSLLPGKKDLDYTTLAIWRLTQDNVKEKVKCYEWRGEDIIAQVEEIKQIINPKDGIFPCEFGLVDYSNVGINIVESFKRDNIPVEGIVFQSSEPTTKKNYKNAMFDEFIFELQCERIKFPSLDKIYEDDVFKTSFDEWCAIERHKKTGINDKIEAPADMHDDHCMSDVMAVWAADRFATFKSAKMDLKKMFKPRMGDVHLSSHNMPTSKGQKRNKYLQ